MKQLSLSDTCHHYFICETPNGETSVGTCKICGYVKEFYNSHDFHDPKRDKGFPSGVGYINHLCQLGADLPIGTLRDMTNDIGHNPRFKRWDDRINAVYNDT
jgi:hypothetical protein